MLARYALQAFYEVVDQSEAGISPLFPANLPTQAEAAVDLILRTAKGRG